MTTASTQFEHERYLYENIRQQHLAAEKRDQLRLARANRPAVTKALLPNSSHAVRAVIGYARRWTVAAVRHQPQSVEVSVD